MRKRHPYLEKMLNQVAKDHGEEGSPVVDPEKVEDLFMGIVKKKSTDFRITDSKESKAKLQSAISSDHEVMNVGAVRSQLFKPDPLNELHYYIRGVDYMKDKLDFAVQDFTRAIEINPSFALAYFARANTYIRLLDYKKAESDLETTLVLEPDMQWAYIDLSYVYTRQGKRDLSLKMIDKLFTQTTGEDFLITENDPIWGYPFMGSW